MRGRGPTTRTAAALALALLLGGCGDDAGAPATSEASPGPAAATPAATTTKADRFDEDRALAAVRLQLSVGQRPAGSPQLRRLAVRLKGRLPRGRFEDVPGHPGLRNVVGRIPGELPAIVVGAHYDTEVAPKGFVGANDSAAGTAVVLEVARVMKGVRRPVGAPEIRFVLFDGEEEPAPTDDFYRDALRGSKAYVAAHAQEVRELVLLDYVGNRGLRLPREGTSTPALWDQVRAASRRAGVASRYFPDEVAGGVIDDHTPFLRAGIPAVDLIDFTYRHADTVRDTIDKLDRRSLDAVGETVVELLRRRR